MYKKLLENSGRKNLLSIFLQQPRRYFSVRELSVRSRLGRNKLKTLLSFFAKRRFLNTIEKKRQKYYQFNSLRAGSEFNSIFKPDKKDLSKDIVTKAVAAAGEIKLAVLSGVFVGLPKAQADLLLVGKIVPKRLEKCLKFMEKLSGREINYAIFSKAEYLERLYRSDWFLREILDKSPVVMIDEISKAAEKKEIERGVVRMMS